jgi:hypothetical protein
LQLKINAADFKISSQEGVVVWCQKNEDPFPFSSQKNDRAVKPDFILIRNFPTSLRTNDFKSLLLGKKNSRINGKIN